MSLLDALNHLNETDGHLEIGEKEKETNTKNGIEKQANTNVNGIKPELVNKNPIKKVKGHLRNESKLLADILDPSSTPTAQDIEKKIRNFAIKSESEYLKSRLKNHSIKPEEYNEYLKIYSNQPRNDNKNASISKDQCDNLDDTDSNDENIFTLSSWQKEMAERQNIDTKSLQSEYLEIKSKEFVKTNTHIPIFSNDFIKKVVSYCMSQNPDGTPNMKFWTPSLFQYLIEKNFLSNSYVKNGIVKAFIDRNSWGLLKLAIIHVSDIPEKDLVYLLKYLISDYSLSSSEQSISNSSSSSSSSKKEKKKPSIEEFFALIICAPRNDSKMMEALKDLNENELVYIIQTLCKWIEKYDRTEVISGTGKYEFSNKKASSLKKFKDIPDFHIVIDFMSLLFDIHFPTFIISKKIHPLLTHLSNLITRELAIYESLETMRGCLASFHKKYQGLGMKRKSEKRVSTDSVKQSKDNIKKNNNWLNDGDVPIYSVELFNFYGEENENNFDEMNIDMDEYDNENNDYVELDNNDYTNKEQEIVPDIA